MTSEIAVMNQRAVALAADSAVTLIDGGAVAIRNDQKKLFNLVSGKPLGVMFFGVADVMGHPWEQLIEHYQRKGRSGTQANLKDYAESFVTMLDHLHEFFPKERGPDEYRRLLASVFRYVFNFAEYLRSTEGGESDTQILSLAIERIWHDYQIKDDGSPRGNLACFPEGFDRQVAAEYAKQIDELIQLGFGPFALAPQAAAQLREIAVFAVVKDLFLEDVTGLVFAGFGAEDRYPAVVTYFTSAIVGGIMKRAQASTDNISNEIRSKIRVFADSEVTNAFIRGIDFNLERRLYGGFRMMMHGLVDQVVGSIPDLAPEARESVRKQFQMQLVPQYFAAFHAMISQYQQQAFINPILRVLEIAGKAELAETARELVSLNVFKKRIMAQRETVGGAIDVAVISREDGFQWMARKSGV